MRQQTHQLARPDVPQLQLPLATAQEDLVQVGARVGHTRHLEGARVKVQLTIEFCRKTYRKITCDKL